MNNIAKVGHKIDKNWLTFPDSIWIVHIQHKLTNQDTWSKQFSVSFYMKTDTLQVVIDNEYARFCQDCRKLKEIRDAIGNWCSIGMHSCTHFFCNNRPQLNHHQQHLWSNEINKHIALLDCHQHVNNFFIITTFAIILLLHCFHFTSNFTLPAPI